MGEDLRHGALTKRLIGVYYDVYNELGFGFLESVYHRALAVALTERGIGHLSQTPISVWYHGRQVGRFFADFLVEGVVILELKACRVVEPAHEAQLTNYLRATDVEVGLLLNFGERPAFQRVFFANDRKQALG
jgi:GxxExxY protein